ncbi:recombination regulator RecX [Lentilactobacillus sp. Marseille-Q4993]|uniref:recombination regulator RecX n=1 Tax=Lentilactobacillus sp. Marseille-Q4993 TaxID=3039492 RepID=UPI0024BCE4E3|nr:recombination regulator RecX [Lentilactobacillus sp. Marseille-Q4993]
MTATITKIEAQKRKGRFNVYLDGQYSFPVSEEVLIKFRLFKGMELEENQINNLKQADQVSKLYSKAIDFLAHNLRTEKEVVDKLSTLTEDEDMINQVIIKLKDLNLVNDEKYAVSYVRTVVRQEKNGPEWINRHLKQKGINDHLILDVLDREYPDSLAVEIASKVADKQLSRSTRDSVKMKINKTNKLLMQRGFSYAQVQEVMASVDPGEVENDDAELLVKMAEKYLKHYSNPDQYVMVNKTKQALYRKGFNLDDISRVIEELTAD